jgi:hypothetical protein
LLGDGSYVYVFGNRFPYTLDCFGPAMPRYYDATSCSKNTCTNPYNFASYYINVKAIFSISLAFLLLSLIFE